MDELKPIHVVIILLAALFSGLILGISTWVLAWILGAERSWIYGASVLVLTLSITWLVLLRRTIRMIEAILEIDLDFDGYIGEPEQPRIIVMDETDKGMTRGWILDDLPGGEYKFSRLAAGVLQDEIPLAERFWTGDGKPYSQNEFRDLRDYLIMRGLLSWASEHDHRQGIEIEPAGRALMRTYAQMIENGLPIQVDNWPAGSVRSSNSRT